MLAFKQLVASLVMAAAMPVIAGPIFLDFEKSPLEGTPAGNLYQDVGVVFTDNAYTVHSYLSDPKPTIGGSFIRYSDPASQAALYLFAANGATQADFFIKVSAGFGETFKMLYTNTDAANDTNFVEVLDANGGVLARYQMGDQGICIDPTTGQNKTGYACNWGEISLSFKGEANSVHIGGVNGAYFFDNMAFGPLDSPPPGNNVPEPAGIVLSLAALGALAWTRKRYQH